MRIEDTIYILRLLFIPFITLLLMTEKSLLKMMTLKLMNLDGVFNEKDIFGITIIK